MKHIRAKNTLIKQAHISSVEFRDKQIVIKSIGPNENIFINYSSEESDMLEKDKTRIMKSLTRSDNSFSSGVFKGLSFTAGLVLGLSVVYFVLKFFLNS